MRNGSLGASALVVGVCMALASMSSFAAKPRTVRGELVHKIVSKWGAHVQEAYKADVGRWARAMTPLLIQADLDTLRKAADARTFEGMNTVLLGKAAATPTSVNRITAGASLGSPVEDLVLVPVAPCRLFDTRIVGGPIPGNSSRDFDVSAVGDYSYQGGATGDCGGVGSADAFAAAVINFTVVTPTGAGYITAYPWGTARPLAATVNYGTGDVRGNLSVVKLDQTSAQHELTIYTYAQTHVVADIVGYFIAPMPTALECLQTSPESVLLLPGAFAFTLAAACPGGYTMTSMHCDSTSLDMPTLTHLEGTCVAENKGGGSATLSAIRTCCRVPGR